ncbi:hypothetical protein ACEN8K_26240, partial [Variovorax sp. CT11-76]
MHCRWQGSRAPTAKDDGSTGWFSLDGRVPELWDAFSGLYRTSDGWVRIHANFAHHREGALRLLGLDPATAVRADAEAALAG